VVISNHRCCAGCLEKQLKIDRLEAQIEQLKAKLRYQDRTAKEGPFGSSTPSSKIPIKPSSLEERQARRGGGKVGHPGHGRRISTVIEADSIERIEADTTCPNCGGHLEDRGLRRRTVIDCEPVKVQTKILELEKKKCAHCGQRIEARAPGVLPKFLYGNQLLTHVAVQHYLYGQTLGQIEKQTEIPYSSLLQALHGLARRLEPVIPVLLDQYRRSPVKHADETGWRTDGRNGYAWLFATPMISIFRFRASRAAAVAKEVFGCRRLPGVLVVDRYHAYNKILCKIQYCYAHLLRNLKDILQEFPENDEIRIFVDALAPLLSSAMQVRKFPGSTRQFLQQASQIKQHIVEVINAKACHPAIQTFQNIFREKAHRLYHWATDRSIPADNNLAERDLRPLVIARKISMGSQSDAGARTRETLMTVLHSLKKQTQHVAPRLKTALDQLAQDPSQDIYRLLFSPNSS
jgi:transposase